MDASTAFKPAAPGAVDRALTISHLHKEYRTGHPVLKDISLKVEGRGMTAIIGPSGTGKSTLVRCINRLVDPPPAKSISAVRISLGSRAARCASRGGGSGWSFRNTTWSSGCR
jgi:ABC-type histidine transport system ATPase subunit